MLEKETLSAVLNYLKISELPSPIKKNGIFVRAIVKVKKANNHESLCYAVNDGSGKPLIKKTFGSMSMIKEIAEIYPITYLEDGALPDFRKKSDIVQFLIRHGVDQDKAESLVMSEDKEKRDEAKKLVIAYCIKSQIERENMKGKVPNKKVETNNSTENGESKDNSDSGETGTEETGDSE